MSNDYFSRENKAARRARRLAEFDSLRGVGSSEDGRMTTQNAGLHAISMVREVLDNFTLPTTPKLSCSGIRNAKTAQHSSRLEDGVVTIFAEFKTLSGINVGFDVPVEIRAGELMDPSVIVVDGAPRIIAQSSFDDMVGRNTIKEQPPVRELFSPPMQKQLASQLYGNRHKQTKVNTGMFSLGANRQAIKDALAGRDAQLVEHTADDTNPMAPAPKEYVPGRHPILMAPPKLKGPMKPGQTYSDDRTQAVPQPTRNESPGSSMMVNTPMPGTPTQNVTAPNKGPGNTQYPWPSGDHTQIDDTQVGKHPGDIGVIPQMPKAPLRGDPRHPMERTMYDPGPRQRPTKRGETESARVSAVEDYDADDKHEKPDHDRNLQDEDWLDPAERTTNDLRVGQEVSVKEELEVKERGGGVFDISVGTKCEIIRDLAGDNKAFVVRFKDGMEAIVERHFLAKSAQYAPPPEEGMPTTENQRQQIEHPQEPQPLVADMDFVGKVNEEINGLREQGLGEIDIKSAIQTRYGPEVLEAVFNKTAP